MSLRLMPVNKLMSKPVRTVEGAESLEDSIKAMSKSNIGCLVVTEGESPVGMLTERDVLRWVSKDPANLNLTMAEVMSKPLISVSPTTSIWEAMEVMGKSKIRHLAVMDKGQVVGVVTQRDIIGVILSNKEMLLGAINREETRRFMLGE